MQLLMCGFAAQMVRNPCNIHSVGALAKDARFALTSQEKNYLTKISSLSNLIWIL